MVRCAALRYCTALRLCAALRYMRRCAALHTALRCAALHTALRYGAANRIARSYIYLIRADPLVLCTRELLRGAAGGHRSANHNEGPALGPMLDLGSKTRKC
jgi:hypothetical protein